MYILTTDEHAVRQACRHIKLPLPHSHKKQNGKTLIIAGSTLFHAPAFWAAEIASHFVDIVHVASVKENNIVFRQMKKKFHNGIVVSRSDIDRYAQEDDTILIGPGMLRYEEGRPDEITTITTPTELEQFSSEADQTAAVTTYCVSRFPSKKIVLDAGALQTVTARQLAKLKKSDTEHLILTPHAGEFEMCFNISLQGKQQHEVAELVSEEAKKLKAIIVLKSGDDIISDGTRTTIVAGGNAGLTKGGSGDILAGLICGFSAKNDSFASAVAASCILKTAADSLFVEKGYWYNNDDLIDAIPRVFAKIRL